MANHPSWWPACAGPALANDIAFFLEIAMNILLVDDEENAVSDHIDALRQAGHAVSYDNNLIAAHDTLIRSFADADPKNHFNLVVIDLYIGSIPPVLMPHYTKLQPGTQNEGQALGQWLWEAAGARRIAARPMHCYFTNFPGNYVLSRPGHEQEFRPLPQGQNEADVHSAMLLEKWAVPPSKIVQRISKVEALWADWSKKP